MPCQNRRMEKARSKREAVAERVRKQLEENVRDISAAIASVAGDGG